jgi:site-specific recombinase XerD
MLDYTSVYKREHLIIKLFLDTGIRISELLTLKKTDIDFDRRTIKVFGKGAKERIVIFSEELKPELKEYVDGFKSEQLVFDLCPATVEHNIKDIARIVGINKKVTPHKLRHSFATLSLQRGMNIVQVQMLLGHSSLNTTQIYTHYGHDELKDAYDKSRSTN